LESDELYRLLSMMNLDELDEALEVIQEMQDAKRLDEQVATAWREQIEAWAAHQRS
jgi:hypothetical protein